MDESGTLRFSPQDVEAIAEVERTADAGERGVATLIRRLRDPSWAVRRAVIGALARAGTPAVGPLCDVLTGDRGDEAELAAAVDALAASRGEVESPLLALADRHPSAPVLCDVAQILGRRRSHGAIPTLERLALHPNDNVGVAAIEALGRVGGGAGLEVLITLAREESFFRTFPAIAALGGSGDRRAIEPLVALLGRPLFAPEAARALGAVGDEAVVPPLAALLQTPQPAPVRAAAVALAAIHRRVTRRAGSGESVEHLLATTPGRDRAAERAASSLRHAEPAEQEALCQVLGWLRAPDGVAALISQLGAGGPAAQAAARGLNAFGAELREPLRAALAVDDGAARLSLLSLATKRTAAAADIIPCLSDPDPQVRHAACAALGRIGDTRCVPRLFDLLGEEDAGVSQAAMAAIQSLGSAQIEPLALGAARSTHPARRRAGLRILAYFGYGSALDLLIHALDDPDDRIRDAAAAGLPYIEDPRSVAALLRACGHRADRTRAAATRALGLVPLSPPVREALRAACGDPDGWVRYYACQSLGKQRDTTSVDVLASLIDDPAGQVRVGVIEALAQLRSTAAAEVMRRTANAADPDLRRAALVGLGQSGRPDALPLLIEATRAVDASTRLVAIGAMSGYEDAPEVVGALVAAARDPIEAVRSAAIEHLGARRSAAATQALVGLLGEGLATEQVVAALAQPGEERVPVLIAALESADERTASLLVTVLARMRRGDADAALLATLTMDNVHARRAATSAMALRATDEMRAALERSIADDPDPETRRLSSLALGH